MDPEFALRKLSKAIANSPARVVTLELTLDSLVRTADLGFLLEGHGGQVLGPSEVPPANWKAIPSEVLAMYTEVQRHSDALKPRCSALERNVKELVEENRRLEVKVRALTEEVATAMEPKYEAEQPFESEAELQDDYDAVIIANRELKRAESVANARACEEIALQTRPRFMKPPPREDRASSKLPEAYESLKGRHQALQSTLEEMKESDSDLQQGSSTEPGQLTLQDNNRHELENRVRQLTQTNETIQAQMQNPPIQTAVARAWCEDFMERFPSLIPGRHLPYVTLPSFSDCNTHWGCQDPELKAYVNHALYVPKRVVWSSPHRSELSGFRRTTGNLFISDDSILYVVPTTATILNIYTQAGLWPRKSSYSPLEVMYTPHLGAMKPVDTAVVIKHFYPGGSILVGCVGLQCIGFDRSLYNALRRRRLNGGGTKRKADSDGPYNV
ncbi:hypothetical protein C8J57DRAFT_1530828 [Mycena rebaudengoi]|nr:hypothetical protein C8J57DRAFT_1530828 [Mycena rebaudengoi]